MAYRIPLFDLNYGSSEENAVIRTLRSKWISMGPNVKKLEERFAAHLDVRHTVGVTNGTAALHLAMRVLKAGPNDEVILPSLTFVATANAVRYVGATPVFADITSEKDFSINPTDIERKITNRTKAIVVMHYAGFSCDMEKVMRLARESDLYVVEDAAHAPDSEFMGKKLGSIGHIGCFSFFSNKNISCAEGGLFVTNESQYGEKARLLRSHGMTSVSYDRAKGYANRYDVDDLGYNYRMDDIRGALLLAQFERLKRDISRRQELRETYISALKGIKGLIIPYENHSHQSSNYIFPVVLKESDTKKRDRVRKRLAEAGIETSVHYPPVHLFSIYDSFRCPLPNTEYVAENEITLPFFPALTMDDIEYIARNLWKAV